MLADRSCHPLYSAASLVGTFGQSRAATGPNWDIRRIEMTWVDPANLVSYWAAAWISAHDLDSPPAAMKSSAATLEVQVVSGTGRVFSYHNRESQRRSTDGYGGRYPSISVHLEPVHEVLHCRSWAARFYTMPGMPRN